MTKHDDPFTSPSGRPWDLLSWKTAHPGERVPVSDQRGTRKGWSVKIVRIGGTERAMHWHAAPRDPGERRVDRWTYVDPEDGVWRVQFGYTGRRWALFGPDGIPEGRELETKMDASLTSASLYIACLIARADRKAAMREGAGQG